MMDLLPFIQRCEQVYDAVLPVQLRRGFGKAPRCHASFNKLHVEYILQHL